MIRDVVLGFVNVGFAPLGLVLRTRSEELDALDEAVRAAAAYRERATKARDAADVLRRFLLTARRLSCGLGRSERASLLRQLIDNALATEEQRT